MRREPLYDTLMVTATVTDSVAEIARNTLFQAEGAGHPQISLIVTKRVRRCKQEFLKNLPIKETEDECETGNARQHKLGDEPSPRATFTSHVEVLLLRPSNKTLMTEVWLQFSL